MSTMKAFATVAIAGLIAAPLSAQSPRERVETARRGTTGTTVRDRIEQTRDRIETTTRGGVLSRTDSRRGASKVPPGHRPPAGMCRVWIDGVPPGHQPAVTDCRSAEVQAARIPNSRVIYGDRESFPGKGKGKVKNRDRDRDDDNHGIFRDRRVDDDDDDDDDRFDDNRGHGNRGKSNGKGKKGHG